MKKPNTNTTIQLAKAIIKGIQEKKGHNIICLNLTKINSTICDYFIICHGDSHRQVDAIASSIEEQTIKQANEKPWHREGIQNAEWVLLDYVNVVAHIFLKEKRDFYNLESLWADAAAVKISENGSIKLTEIKSKTTKTKKGASKKQFLNIFK